MPKLIYVHEGTERESPVSKRWKLVNPHYFSGLYERERNMDLWQSVLKYVCNSGWVDTWICSYEIFCKMVHPLACY
jgi:hypothetical protein